MIRQRLRRSFLPPLATGSASQAEVRLVSLALESCRFSWSSSEQRKRMHHNQSGPSPKSLSQEANPLFSAWNLTPQISASYNTPVRQERFGVDRPVSKFYGCVNQALRFRKGLCVGKRSQVAEKLSLVRARRPPFVRTPLTRCLHGLHPSGLCRKTRNRDH